MGKRHHHKRTHSEAILDDNEENDSDDEGGMRKEAYVDEGDIMAGIRRKDDYAARMESIKVKKISFYHDQIIFDFGSFLFSFIFSLIRFFIIVQFLSFLSTLFTNPFLLSFSFIILK